MSDLSHLNATEFVKAYQNQFSLMPWQEEVIKMASRADKPLMIYANANSRWHIKLRQLEAAWVSGIETQMVSGDYESIKNKKYNLIFDDFKNTI